MPLFYSFPQLKKLQKMEGNQDLTQNIRGICMSSPSLKYIFIMPDDVLLRQKPAHMAVT
jgi:uncharacterized membrane protein YukC